jgi:hypothetical protein
MIDPVWTLLLNNLDTPHPGLLPQGEKENVFPDSGEETPSISI